MDTQIGQMQMQMYKELGKITRRLRVISSTLGDTSREFKKSAEVLKGQLPQVSESITKNITDPINDANTSVSKLDKTMDKMSKGVEKRTNVIKRHKIAFTMLGMSLLGVGAGAIYLTKKYRMLKTAAALANKNIIGIFALRNQIKRGWEYAKAGIAGFMAYLAALRTTEIESKIRSIEGAVGALGINLERVALSIASSLGEDITDVLSSLKLALERGMPENLLKEYASLNIKLGKSFDFSSEQAEEFSGVLWNLGVNYKNVADRLAYTAKISKMTSSELRDMTVQMQENLRISTIKDDTIKSWYAFGAALRNANISASDTNEIVGALGGLLKEATDVNNPERMARAITNLRAMGLDKESLDKALKTQDIGMLAQGVISQVQKMGGISKNSSVIAEYLGVDLEVLRKLIQAYDNSGKYLSKSISEFKQEIAGAGDQELEKIYRKRKGALSEIIYDIGNLADQFVTEIGRPFKIIGEVILKPVRFAMKWTVKLLQWLNSSTDGWFTLGTTITASYWSLKRIIKLIKALPIPIGTISKLVVTYGTKFIGILSKIPVLNQLILLSQMHWAKTLPVLIAKITTLYATLKKIRIVSAAIDFVSAWFQGFKGILSLGPKLIALFRTIAMWAMANPWMALATVAVLIIFNWKKVKAWFWAFVEWFKNDFPKYIDYGIKKILGWIKGFGRWIKNIAVSLKNWIVGVFKNIWDNITEFFADIGIDINDFWKSIKDSGKQWFEDLLYPFKKVYEWAKEKFGWLFKWFDRSTKVGQGFGDMSPNIKKSDTVSAPLSKVKPDTGGMTLSNLGIADKDLKSTKIGQGVGDITPNIKKSDTINVPLSKLKSETGGMTLVTNKNLKASNTPVTGGAAGLLERIAIGEGTAGVKGYDTVYGYGKYSQPSKPISQMTLSEVKAYQKEQIAATKGKIPGTTSGTGAVGKYQVTQTTLAAQQKKLGLSDNDLFTADIQDKIGESLLNGRGYQKWKAGKMSDEDFQRNLSKEWASVENPGTGTGFYAGQRAATSTSDIQAAMAMARQEPTIPIIQNTKDPELARLVALLEQQNADQKRYHDENLKQREGLSKNQTTKTEKSSRDVKLQIATQTDPLVAKRGMNEVVNAYGV